MRIGVDVGNSVAKAYVDDGDEERWVAAPFDEVAGFVAHLVALQPTRVGVVGVGFERALRLRPQIRDALPWARYPGENPIDAETAAQARGTLHLLEHEGKQHDAYVIAGVGSGVSYTAVGPHGTFRADFGRAHGGAALEWARRVVGQDGPVYLPNADHPRGAFATADLYLGDCIETLRGTPMEHFVVAHFANHRHAEAGALWLSAVDALAVGIVKDLLDSRSVGNAITRATRSADGTRTLVTVGGTCDMFPSFGTRLRLWCERAGWGCVIPAKGRFAGAIGAALWAADDA